MKIFDFQIGNKKIKYGRGVVAIFIATMMFMLYSISPDIAVKTFIANVIVMTSAGSTILYVVNNSGIYPVSLTMMVKIPPHYWESRHVLVGIPIGTLISVALSYIFGVYIGENILIHVAASVWISALSLCTASQLALARNGFYVATKPVHKIIRMTYLLVAASGIMLYVILVSAPSGVMSFLLFFVLLVSLIALDSICLHMVRRSSYILSNKG